MSANHMSQSQYNSGAACATPSALTQVYSGVHLLLHRSWSWFSKQITAFPVRIMCFSFNSICAFCFFLESSHSLRELAHATAFRNRRLPCKNQTALPQLDIHDILELQGSKIFFLRFLYISNNATDACIRLLVCLERLHPSQWLNTSTAGLVCSCRI